MAYYIEPYSDGDFEEFYRIYLEEFGHESPIPSKLRRMTAKSSFNDSESIYRAIRRGEDGQRVGYIQVVDTKADTWELGIYICEAWRYQGAGRAAVIAMLDELTGTYGHHEFRVRIERGNAASVAHFTGIGFEPAGTELTGMSDEFVKREIERAGEDATPEEVDRLRQLEELVMGARREVGVYTIVWPRPSCPAHS